ncbi:family 78 glycoside hydrolase catalytic domain [Actinotalea sp. AC32]|nr:family 78 glycoside hydrolase catalytic domain [Actinotalea sp. AC32]
MTVSSPVVVDRLRAAERGRPQHLADPAPELSWSVRTDLPGWTQRSAEIEVTLDGDPSTHRVEGPASQHVPWPARPLRAYETASVRVRVAGTDGSESGWSDAVELVTGPLGPADWEASLVTAAADPGERGTIRLRTVVDVPGDVVRATLSATSHGVHELVVDGTVVGDEVLNPGWTAYDRRLAFQTYDVTALLRPGRLVLGATVAPGWFGELYGFQGHTSRRYTGPLALSAQLRLERADGSVTSVVTDGSWEATTTGPTLEATIYHGETYDSRLADDALMDPAVPLPDAAPAVVVDADVERLVPQSSPPVRRHESLPVREVLTSPSGATLLDFGQNLVGWLRVRASGPAGTTITLRHAEVLEDGELGVRPLRVAEATDRWTLAGTGDETWSPRFTFHGFRYAEVSGWPGALDPTAIEAVVVHSDMERTGDLSTGDEMLDQLHRNVVWGMRGNVLSLPTDCPQRDERLGWTGDIQVFSPTASYLYDADGFLRSWLEDLAHEQADADGVVPFVVPAALRGGMPPAAAWGDAATVVPMTLWERFGDVEVLRRQYPSMRAWVEALRRTTQDGDLWTGGFQFGDWLDPAAPPDDAARARTDADIVASAYYHRSTRLLADAAALLGHDDDAERYGALAERIALAFRETYVTPRGRMTSDAQTAYALALVFDIVEDEQVRARMGDRLADLVRAHGYHIGTGFVGTPIVLDALTSTGHVDTAYRLLQQTENPSWLYPVTMGATTVWERWDSMLPDGSINPGEMTSFNHYALGAVADWMHRVLGGLAPGAPGYAVVEVAPVPGGRVRRAHATLDTGYGRVDVRWTWHDGDFDLAVSVPPGTTARVRLPGTDDVVEVGSGSHTWRTPLPEPSATGEPVTLDSSMAAVVDDDEVRRAVLAVCEEVGYENARDWSDRGRWRTDTTLRQALQMPGPDAAPRIAAALEEIASARMRG